MKTIKTLRQISRQIYRTIPAVFILFLIIVFTAAANTANAATYYLDANVTNSGNGTSWATAFKTIANAQTALNALPNKGSGNIVDVNTGNYGSYIEANITRTNWLTFKAAAGKTPVLEKINIQNSTKQNTYLKLDGFKVQAPAPNPMPADDGYWHSGNRMLTLYNANYVNISNCNFVGYNKYLTTGHDVRYCDNFTYDHNKQQKTRNGILVYQSSNPTISHNYISEMSDGSGISIYTGCPNAIVSYNHVFGMYTHQDDPYFPHSLVGTANYHPGSLMSIRSSPITIRNNIIHDGGSQLLMFYDDSGPYSDVLMENNLFYNGGFSDGISASYFTGRLAFYKLAPSADHPIVIRNNTFVGRVGTSSINLASLSSRYYGNTVYSYNPASGYDGTGLTVVNNVLVGQWTSNGNGLPHPAVYANMTEGYNIAWYRTPAVGGSYLNNTTAFWYADGKYHGYPCYFENLGSGTFSTPEYVYSRDGVTKFFVAAGMYFGPAGSYADRDRDRQGLLDFRLADGSPAINSGDTNNQPTDSLGTIGPDGFIRDDGSSRNATHHSVGCYEYGPTEPSNPIGKDAPPDLSFAPIGNKEVNEGSALTFTVDTNDPNVKVSIEKHNLPSEPNLTDNIFRWTPTYKDAGSYEATFVAQKDLFEDLETITITVHNVNRPPVLAAIGNMSVNENSLLNFLVSATDPDGDSITYSAENLPIGATFSSQYFNWTPDSNQAGTYQVKFVASDSQAQDSQTVTLTVNDVVATLLNENFDDRNFTGWSIINEGSKYGPSSWSAATGTMVQKSNIYSSTSSLSAPGTYALYGKGIAWTNYRVSLTIKSSDNDSLGVMFRYKDNNNYYRFSWDSERKTRQLVKKCNGTFTLLCKDSVPYVVGRNYRLDIVANGTKLQIFIDNTLVLQTTDSSLSSGSIALYSWANAGSYFDNIVAQRL